jgi:hypothetical protein
VLLGSISDLRTGMLLVSVDPLTDAHADEQARIDAAIATLDPHSEPAVPRAAAP